MAELNISLPEAMRAFIDEQITSGEYGTASDYLQALVQEDQKRKALARMEALLLEGLESGPAAPMTDADWVEMEGRFSKRHPSVDHS